MQGSLPLALLALFGVTDAYAALHCVSTPAQLDAAFAQSSGNGVDDEIRIRSGTYMDDNVHASAFGANLHDAQSLTVSGGWEGAQCQTQIADATRTVLDGRGIQRPLDFAWPEANSTGTLTLRNLTLRNGSATERGGCLSVSSVMPGSTGAALIENLVAYGCSAGTSGGAISVSIGKAPATLRNLELRDNTSKVGAALILFADAPSHVSNVTASGNLSTLASSAAVWLQVGPAGAIFASNNILWGNESPGGARDLHLQGSEITLIRNLIGNRTGSEPTAFSNGNFAADPGFVDDGMRLRHDSPARDRGTNAPLGGISFEDVAGGERIQGLAIDLGAYEISVIHASGFE